LLVKLKELGHRSTRFAKLFAWPPAKEQALSTRAIQKNSSSELAGFVRLNEGIKGVVLIAFQINIMALNAILLAHRAGEVALGFGVISKELRSLSVELTGLMQELSKDAYLAVNLISDLLRQERRYRLL
jgi:hypothetical protein